MTKGFVQLKEWRSMGIIYFQEREKLTGRVIAKIVRRKRGAAKRKNLVYLIEYFAMVFHPHYAKPSQLR